MKKILLLCLIIIVINLSAQEWENISPLPYSYNGIKGNFVSADEGWCFEDSQDFAKNLYHTNDGGENWDMIYTLDDSLGFFSSLTMIDSQYGWLTVEHNEWNNNYTYYLRTSDGGFNWEDMSEYMPDDFFAYAFCFIDNNVGFHSAGFDYDNQISKIYKTIDGGYSWYITETPIVYFPYPYHIDYSSNKFFFLNNNIGWAACSAAIGGGLVLNTNDAGESWEVALNNGSTDLFDIHFINEAVGGCAGRNASFSHVFLTNDNFDSFSYINDNWLTEMGQFAQAINYQNSYIIWITGSPGKIFRSDDGGETFTLHQTIDAELKTITFFGNTGYIFGKNNALLRYVEPVEASDEIMLNQNGYSLSNYPNPFNPTTTIDFSIQLDCIVELSVYNIKGQKIKTLLNEPSLNGNHQVIWNGTDENQKAVGSGVYFYKLLINGNPESIKKCLLLK